MFGAGAVDVDAVDPVGVGVGWELDVIAKSRGVGRL